MATSGMGSAWQTGLSRHLTRRLRTATAGDTRRRRVASGSAVVLALMLGYHAFFGNNGVVSYQGKRSEHQALAQQIGRLERENARMKQHVDHLKTDPAAIEYEASKRLHYVRHDQVIVLNNDPPAGAALSARK